MGWRVGDRIQVAPTTGYSSGEANTFRIAAFGDHNLVRLAGSYPGRTEHGAATQGFAAQFEHLNRNPKPSAFLRSAEVIHLSRTVVFTGDDFRHVPCDPALTADPHTRISSQGCHCQNNGRSVCTLGLHINHMFGGKSRMQHVRAEKCGQRGVLGKYCMHLHMMGDCPSCLFEGNAVEYSHQRAYNVHGTHRSTWRFNVATDVRGANFYIEDGNELWTHLEYNVAVCPFRLNDPYKSGCTIPGSPNGQADTSLNQAGIWLTGPQNHMIGNRMSNSFNGMLVDVNHHGRGGGGVWQKSCVYGQRVGRWEGNTFHSHGRFGTYGLGNFFPKRDVGMLQTLETNGELPGGTAAGSSVCGQGFNLDGTDSGWTHAIKDNFDYQNAFVGHYGAGDLQYLGHTAVDALNLIYWKTSKSPADGCSALLQDGYYRGGNLGLPDQGAFLLEGLTIDGRTTLESNHHCDVGVTGVLCAPHYILHNTTRKDLVAGSDSGWLSGFNGQATVFVAAPPDCAANVGRTLEEAYAAGSFFPAGFCSLIHSRYSYLLDPALGPLSDSEAGHASPSPSGGEAATDTQHSYLVSLGRPERSVAGLADNKKTQCRLKNSICAPTTGTLGVQCCSDNAESSQEGGVATGSRPGCHDGIAWAAAAEICRDNGNRLCTAAEVQAGYGAGTGCNFDSRHVWTSTMCNSTTAANDEDECSGSTSSSSSSSTSDATLQDNGMCTRSQSLGDDAVYGRTGAQLAGRYGQGILCRVPLRVLKIYSHSMVAQANAKSSNVAPPLRVEVWKDEARPTGVVPVYERPADAETLIAFHAIGDTATNGAQVKQGYSVPVVHHNDNPHTTRFGWFRYRVSLGSFTDSSVRDPVPADWIIEFSDPIFDNRFGAEDHLLLDVVGRQCPAAAEGVSNQHDRMFLVADDGGINKALRVDGPARGRGACTGHAPMSPVNCAARTASEILTATECPGQCGISSCPLDRSYCDCGSRVCKCRPGFTDVITSPGGGSNEFASTGGETRMLRDICPLDLCAAARCGDHGVCAAQYLGGDLPVSQTACVCEAPWQGPRCEENLCAMGAPGHRDCSGHGACSPTAGGRNATQCMCDQGYSGENCQTSCDAVCGGSFPFGCATTAAPETYGLLCGRNGGGCRYPSSKAELKNSVQDGHWCAYFSRGDERKVPTCDTHNDCRYTAAYDCFRGQCPEEAPIRPDGTPCNSLPWGSCADGECVEGPVQTASVDGAATPHVQPSLPPSGVATAAAFITIIAGVNAFSCPQVFIQPGQQVAWWVGLPGYDIVETVSAGSCAPKAGGFKYAYQQLYGGAMHAFHDAGTYHYMSTAQCSSGMTGSIVVAPIIGSPTPGPSCQQHLAAPGPDSPSPAWAPSESPERGSVGGVSTPAPGSRMPAITVTSNGLTFAPEEVVVVVGQPLIWQVDVSHDVVETVGRAGSCDAKDGGFRLGYGGGSTTFTSIGTYQYKCSPHCSLGMTGTVRVVATEAEVYCTDSGFPLLERSGHGDVCRALGPNDLSWSCPVGCSLTPNGCAAATGSTNGPCQVITSTLDMQSNTPTPAPAGNSISESHTPSKAPSPTSNGTPPPGLGRNRQNETLVPAASATRGPMITIFVAVGIIMLVW
jgi:plastocyanin